jgi:hypothetical protein
MTLKRRLLIAWKGSPKSYISFDSYNDSSVKIMTVIAPFSGR